MTETGKLPDAPHWFTDVTGDTRLHELGDDLHEQETEMDEESPRYFWALHPDDETVVICNDVVSCNYVAWRNLDDEDKWVIEWIRTAGEIIRSHAN